MEKPRFFSFDRFTTNEEYDEIVSYVEPGWYASRQEGSHDFQYIACYFIAPSECDSRELPNENDLGTPFLVP